MQHVEQQKKEEREGALMHWEDGTGSIILRSAYVCLCVTVHPERESNILCVFISVCMCWRMGGRHQGRSVR